MKGPFKIADRAGRRRRSTRTICGIPLWDIAYGPDLNGQGNYGHARGILAMGDTAVGVIAIGHLSCGVVATGQVCFGVIAIGSLAVGLVAAGLTCFGVVAVGGVTVGRWVHGVLVLRIS